MEPIICNPMDLSYAFSEVKGSGKVGREAADPTMIRWKERYWLFPSMSGGFWVSENLADWEFIERPDMPVYDYAPDIQIVDDVLYFSASFSTKENGPIYRVTDPIAGTFEEVSRPLQFWDPNLFQDNDGRTYLYWGCSNKTPIRGIEIDPKTMAAIGNPADLITGQPDIHGWERIGENNDPDAPIPFSQKLVRLFLGKAPYIEGAYMPKYRDRYYLQYAGPGTELAGYGNGVYVGNGPLGPFTYQQSNPFSHRPGGFITGAGHGSTMQDNYGNWWHVASMRISLKYNFERRLGLFPAGFDEDGTLFCNQNYADWPMRIPQGKFDPWKDVFAGLMLLSYGKKVTVSSEAETGSACNLTDESIRTIWTAAEPDAGQWAMVDLGKVMDVCAVQLNFYEDNDIVVKHKKSDYHGSFPARHLTVDAGSICYLLEGSTDGKNWTILKDRRSTDTDRPHELIVFDEGVSLRYVRITGEKMPYDARLCMSAIRVFGHGGGTAPGRAKGTAKQNGNVSAKLVWDAIPDADGYNIRYGNHPNKLYHSWMVYGQTELQMNCLNEGQKYFFAIDSFNENGITPGDVFEMK